MQRIAALLPALALAAAPLAQVPSASAGEPPSDASTRVVRFWASSSVDGSRWVQAIGRGVARLAYDPSLTRLDVGSSDPFMSFSRLPGVGKYPLVDRAATPAQGEVRFAPRAPYDSDCSGQQPVSGTVDVAAVEYDDEGLPETLAATFRWRCAYPGLSYQAQVQVSPDGTAPPAAPWLTVSAPAAPTRVVLGTTATTRWLVRNAGTAPAKVTSADIAPAPGLEATVDDSACRTVLAAGAVCQVVSTTTASEEDSPRMSGQTLNVHSEDPSASPGAGPDGEDDARLPISSASAAVAVVGPATPPTVSAGIAVPGVAMLNWGWPEGEPQTGSATATDILVEQLVAGQVVRRSVLPLTSPAVLRGTPQSGDVSLRLTVRTDQGELATSQLITMPVRREGILRGRQVQPLGVADNRYDPPSLLDVPADVDVLAVEQTPDRQRLVVSGQRRDGTGVVGVTDGWGADWRQLISTPYATPFVRVAPTGTYAVVSDGRRGATRVDLTTGESSLLPMCCAPVGFSSDGTRLLLLSYPFANYGLTWLDLASGSYSAPVPGTAGAVFADVSRDNSIAFITEGAAGRSPVMVLRPGTSMPKVLWNRPGASFPRWDSTGTRLAVATATGVDVREADGSIRTAEYLRSWMPSWFEGVSTSPPAVALTPPVSTTGVQGWTGATSRIAFSVDDPDDRTGSVKTTCRVDALPAQPCSSPLTITGLAAGSHTVAVTAVDPAGNIGQSTTAWRVDLTAPTATATSLPAVNLASSTTTLRYSAVDAGGSGVWSYDIAYREARPGAASLGPWVYPSPWQGLRSTSLPIRLIRGGYQCLAVRAHDRAGNTGRWSPAACTTTPYDDRNLALRYSGFVRTSSSAAFLGTLTYARRAGASLVLPTPKGAVGRRLALVATRCVTCGSVAVEWAGTRTVVSLRASATQYHTVLWLPASRTVRSGPVYVTTTSTAYVAVDGLVVGR